MKNSQAIIFGSVAVVVVGILLFLKTTTGKAVGKQVGDTVTGLVGALLDPIAKTTDGLGVAIYDALHPVPAATAQTDINWTRGILLWLQQQGATHGEALQAVSAWHSGLPAPTMDNVLRVRAGQAAYP